MIESIVMYGIQELHKFVQEEAKTISGLDQQVASIERELRRMQCFLKDADAKREGDERVKNWVREVRESTYEVEDIIATYISQHKGGSGFGYSMQRYVCFVNHLMDKRVVCREIKSIKNKINEISASRLTYGIENLGSGVGMEATSSLSLRERRRSTPLAEEGDVVGIEEDVQKLVERLTEKQTLRRCVVSILGMGGLGKTTLAKKVYNSDAIKRHFDIYAWVYVSQEYRTKEILEEIGKRVIGLRMEELARKHEGELKEMLRASLMRVRYLIIMDDVWKTDVWANLKSAFPDALNGSRILFTTRNREVAMHADPRSPPHELELLNEEQGWQLLKKKSFSEEGFHLQAEMETIGKQIVRKCAGLPLAIIVMGGLLARKDKSIASWHNVLRNVSLQLTKNPDHLSEILALSYNDLPYYLNSCFLYLGVYPEDHKINAKKLIQLWVAEGFIQQEGNITMEETGEEYLEELADRCLIQVSQRRSDGLVKSCRVHDILRELCIMEAKEDEFFRNFHDTTDQAALKSSRRIALHSNTDSFVPLSQYTPGVRSLLYITREEHLNSRALKFLCHNLRLLRVLDLEGVKTAELPNEIGELIHLKYLRLRRMGLKRLPPSVAHLDHLQTMDIRSHIRHLPSAIWKMKNLRHIYMLPTNKMKNPQPHLLTNLQTLSNMEAGDWIGQGLKGLKNLRKLGVCGYLNTHQIILSDALRELSNLQTLRLEAWESIPASALVLPNHSYMYKLFLQGKLPVLPASHDFPRSLSKLSLKNTALLHDSFLVLQELPNLRDLQLLPNSYVDNKLVCSSAGFPRLETLELGDLRELVEWEVEQGAMPCLRRLLIFCCFNLQSVPGGLQYTTSLKELELWEMGQTLISRLTADDGADKYIISHIPSVIIRRAGDQITAMPSIVSKILKGESR